MNQLFRKTKDVGELRKDANKDKKKKKKKDKAKPFINTKNKILLPTSNIDKMRENNRTKILLDLEFSP